MRLLLFVLALLVLVFGLGCLNYTTDGKADSHREWARAKGLPEPSNEIFLLGAAGTAAGAGLLGFVIGRGRRP